MSPFLFFHSRKRFHMPRTNRRSKFQLFRCLPSEIVIDILSRLPIRTIVVCKCVCRSWRDLLRTREFVEFHLSRPVPGLVIDWYPGDLKIFGFDNELSLRHYDLHYKPITKIDSVELKGSLMQGSARGLLLLVREVSEKVHGIYICNPITREYIKLPQDRLEYSRNTVLAYGFGVSRITALHKVVAILHECDDSAHTLLKVRISICHVYTLGTGIWRSVTLPTPFLYEGLALGVYLNGSLHWLVQDSENSHCISCFDLETEIFSTFSLPVPHNEIIYCDLVVLGDRLCVSDKSCVDEVVFWLMKEYGDEKSWTKEFVIDPGPKLYDYFCQWYTVDPIKVFKNGDILLALQKTCMVYYSNKTKTTKKCKLFGESGFTGMNAMFHSSSFLSLDSFGNERVSRY